MVAPRSEAEIAAIFAHYTKGEVDPEAFAAIAPFAVGATPAQIAGWIRQAPPQEKLNDISCSKT